MIVKPIGFENKKIDGPKNVKKSGLEKNTKSASETEKSANILPIVIEVVEGTAVPVESMQEVEVLGVTDRIRNLRRFGGQRLGDGTSWMIVCCCVFCGYCGATRRNSINKVCYFINGLFVRNCCPHQK